MTIFKASLHLINLLRKAKTIGGKYLKRWQVSNPKTGKMKWVYKYKPVSQRGAHEVTGKTFEKKTGLGKEEHKSAVEKALQSGNRVSLHVLRDYPDLVQKYGMSKRLERADKINAKVKEIRGKNQVKPEENDRNQSKFSVANKYDLDKEQKEADEIYDWNGSEKQIAWAEKIRDTKLEQIKNFLIDAEAEYRPSRRGGIPGESYKDKILNLRKNFFDLASFKSANFWINNRDSSPESFGRLIFLKDDDDDISGYVFKDSWETQFQDNIKDIKNEFLKKSQE